MHYPLIDNAKDAIFCTDLNGLVCYSNKSAEALFGYTKEELMGKSVNGLLPLELFKKYERDLANILQEIPAASIDTKLVTKSKKQIMVSVQNSSIKDASDNITGISTIIREISILNRGKGNAFAIIEMAPDPTIVVNENGEIILANSQIKTQFGYSKEALYGNKVDLLFHESHLKSLKLKAEDKTDDFTSKNIISGKEVFLTTNTEKEIPVELTLSQLKTEDGSFSIVAIRDLTERKTNENLLRKLLNSTPDAMVVASKDGIIRMVNKQAIAFFGYEREELIGQKLEILMPERFHNVHPGHHAKFHEKPKVRPMGSGLDLFGKRKNGEEFPIEISLSPIDFNNENYAIAAIRDISSRKKTEEIFKELLNSSPDAMVVASQEGIIKMVNKQAIAVFGYERKELIGQKLEILMPERFHKVHPGHQSKFHEKPKVRPMGSGLALFGKRKNGEEFSIEISLSPIEFENENYAIAAIRDITDRIAIEKKIASFNQQLTAKNKELEQFTSIASHDMQEPLNSIIGLIDLIQEDHKELLDEEIGEYLSMISGSAARMKALIKSLLEFAISGNEKETDVVDCNKVMNELKTDMAALISKTDTHLIVGDLPTVKGYSAKLRLLFQNLISNAIKFQSDDRTPLIKISAIKENQHWVFSFEDNGIGIEEKHLNKIFEIFQRLHNASEIEGTGIGLAHCKKIVEMHNGKIWVESTPGVGSTFFFMIPD